MWVVQSTINWNKQLEKTAPLRKRSAIGSAADECRCRINPAPGCELLPIWDWLGDENDRYTHQSEHWILMDHFSCATHCSRRQMSPNDRTEEGRRPGNWQPSKNKKKKKKRKRRIDIYVTWSSIKQHFIRDILLRISCITSELRGGETPLRHIRRRLRPKLLEERWIRPKWAQFGSFHTDWRDSLPSWFPFRKTTSRRKAKYLDGLISGVAFALPFSNFVYYYFIIISFFFFWLSIFLVSISLVQTP